MTCLRDPVYWRILKRITDYFILFKKLLPTYTREEFDFPGVKVESLSTDKLVTFIDEFDMDITNAMYLDETELKKMRSDKLYVARLRRVNNYPFKITTEVVSDKTVDAVVRVFIGPKFDCMGRLMGVNDKRLDMLEIDNFIYKLETGKNTIVRDVKDMHTVFRDRPWTRTIWDKALDTSMTRNDKITEEWWHKSRIGFSSRLLLPLGRKGGLDMQLFVIVTPVRTGLVLPTIDMTVMQERRVCYYTVCVDTMPLGFPFDREIDLTRFFTPNMKFLDIKIFRKDMQLANNIKDMDLTYMVMKRDDLTYLDTDMLVNWTYKDVMLTRF